MVEAHCGCAQQLQVMIDTLYFISFLFGLDLFVVNYFDTLLLCVQQRSALENWRGTLDCKAKLGVVGLVSCW
jgi:maltodextrin utilization protein YvdJ